MFSDKKDFFRLASLFPDRAEDKLITINPVTWAEMVHLSAHDCLDIDTSYTQIKAGICGCLFGVLVRVTRHVTADTCLLSWGASGRTFVCSSPRHGRWHINKDASHCRHDECLVDSIMSS